MGEPMSYVNRVAALVSGILLYIASSYIGAVSIQAWHFKLVPSIFQAEMALFSLAWGWATFRWIARPPSAVLWCLGGAVVAGIGFGFASELRGYHMCLD